MRPAYGLTWAIGLPAVALVLFVATPTLVHAPEEANQLSAPATQGDVGSDPILKRDQLLGDMCVLRTAPTKHGTTIALQETSEAFGNVIGGVKTGAVYEGATFMTIKADAEKLWGLPGGPFNASAYQIHGHGSSTQQCAQPEHDQRD